METNAGARPRVAVRGTAGDTVRERLRNMALSASKPLLNRLAKPSGATRHHLVTVMVTASASPLNRNQPSCKSCCFRYVSCSFHRALQCCSRTMGHASGNQAPHCS